MAEEKPQHTKQTNKQTKYKRTNSQLTKSLSIIWPKSATQNYNLVLGQIEFDTPGLGYYDA